MHAHATDLPVVLDQACVRVPGLVVLDQVSLMFHAGGPTALIGPNGSGKTTLLKVAMGLMTVTSGQVTWGGRASAPPRQRSIMLQRPTMLRRSAAANVEYALGSIGVARTQWRSRVDELLALVGLAGLGGRPARQLSGGEQQRLALARALAREPEVLFLDEPTASLDPAATKALEDVVRAVAARGITVIFSTHDLGSARRLADRVVLLHRGRLVESAEASSFFTRPQTDEARRFIAGELLI